MGAALALVAIATLPGGCGGDGGSPEALCRAVTDDEGVASALQGFDPTDPERALEQLRPARVALGELRDAAPDEVDDALDIEIAYVQALIDGLEDVGPGEAAEAAQRVQAATEAHPDVDDAAAELAAFAEREC